MGFVATDLQPGIIRHRAAIGPVAHHHRRLFPAKGADPSHLSGERQ